jgi:hypothetical protein
LEPNLNHEIETILKKNSEVWAAYESGRFDVSDSIENGVRKIVLKEKLGFQSKSMFRGQIAVGELVKIYSANECPKTEKRSFSCVIGKPFREMEKEGIVTYRMYSGECL